MARRDDPILEKGLPSNTDAEKSTLGAILLDNQAYNLAAEILIADDFSHDANRRIFDRMVALQESNPPRPIDPVTLTEELLRTGELEAVGGVKYLSDLTGDLPRSINVAHYAQIVKDKSVLRRTIHASNAIMREALEGPESVAEFLDRAESALLEIGGAHTTGRPQSLGQIYHQSFGSLDSLIPQSRQLSGIATGITKFDELTCGLQAGDLIIIAARPSMGKTACALTFAAHIALRLELPVLIFSVEMRKEALLTRLLCMEARVDSHAFRSGFINREDVRKLSDALGRLIAAPIFIDDTAGLRLQEMHAKARRMNAEHKLAAIFVDYIQLMTPPKAENQNQAIAALSRGLKAMAKEMGIPIVALSQLSRATDTRGGDHHPQLSDLRDSGAIEQDADLVAFLYREEYYMRMAGREVTDDIAGKAEIIIAKQRNGPTDKVPCVFLDRFGRFDNLAEGYAGPTEGYE